MAKNEAYHLAQKQSLSLESKIQMTQQRIRDWIDQNGQVLVLPSASCLSAYEDRRVRVLDGK